MRKIIILIIVVFTIPILLFLFKKDKNTKIVDVSAIELTTNIIRYDQAFFKVDTNNLLSSLLDLKQKDTLFFDFYTQQLMNFGVVTDTYSVSAKSIEDFLTNPYIQGLQDTVQLRFSNFSIWQKEINTAFKHFNYYFPNKPLPKVYTMVSEFSYNAATLDTSILAIGLDLYLGKDYIYYPSMNFPYYLIQRFEPEYIVPNAMEVLYNGYFGKNDMAATPSLINAMIDEGKKMYFMECMQPKKPKHLLIGYSEEQMEWCKQEEVEIWKFYIRENLLYSKDFIEHNRHIRDAAATMGMPDGSPGKVGVWVGWQIVNAFMAKNAKTISLPQMLKLDNSIILEKSGYKPI